jgi:hypothetical protein
MCAKLLPSSVRGILMTLWYGTLLARLWPLARCHRHHRHCHGHRCCGSPLLRFAIMPLPPHLKDQLSLFDFLSGFQENEEFVTYFNFLGVDFGAAFTLHFILIMFVWGHLNTTIYHVSFLLSVCFSDVGATEGIDNLTAYFLRRMLISCVGIGISHVPG